MGVITCRLPTTNASCLVLHLLPRLPCNTTRLRRLGLAAVDVAHLHVGMHLAVAEGLAHTHEEDLVLVLGPVEHVVPEEEGVACMWSAL